MLRVLMLARSLLALLEERCEAGTEAHRWVAGRSLVALVPPAVGAAKLGPLVLLAAVAAKEEEEDGMADWAALAGLEAVARMTTPSERAPAATMVAVLRTAAAPSTATVPSAAEAQRARVLACLNRSSTAPACCPEVRHPRWPAGAAALLQSPGLAEQGMH